jgi:DNA ligase (NAD+)
MNDSQRIDDLRQKLHQANVDYYRHSAPTLSDAEFDRLFKELQQLEAAHPELADANSPTARVGSDLKNTFAKVKHVVPMQSLENAFSAQEVVSRLANETGHVQLQVICEPKIDGLSLNLTYQDSNLVQAVTRGDHEVGDDVTANAKTIHSIPLKINTTGRVDIRGEVYFSKEQFEKINAALPDEDKFANARNAASGTLKQKNSKEVASRGLSFIAYRIIDDELIHLSQAEVLGTLDQLGFYTASKISKVFDLTTPALESFLAGFCKIRKTLPYETDGVVIKVNSLQMQAQLGDKTRAPRWAAAYKFPQEKVKTTLLGITIQVGRTGRLTPVLELAPVNVMGVTVKRATAHNQNQIDKHGINIGDEIFIERGGEVIPKLLGLAVKHSEGTYQFPNYCPCCSKPVHRDGANYFCGNPDCKAQVTGNIQHAVSKGALDMDGCGVAQISELYAAGCRSLSDVLAVNPSFMTPADKSKFLAERERVKMAPLWRKIVALGIEGVGVTSAKDLTEEFSSLAEMIQAGKAKLVSILGPVAADNFVTYVDENLAELEALDELGFKFDEEKKTATTGPLAGKILVITGTSTVGTRPEVSAMVERAGGKMKGSVSKGVDYLIVCPGGGRNKAVAAEKLGTKCIDESELFRLMGIPMPAGVSPLLPPGEEI